MFFRPDERKVVIIAALSLVVAVVCFGILQSTGTVENGALSIGGAFVGFVVSFGLMNRAWPQTPGLEAQAEKADSPLVVEEVLKVLDLRDAPPTDKPQRVRLNDYYRVRRTARDARLTLHYATSGSVDFVGSPTHPGLRDNWRLVAEEKVPDEGQAVEPTHPGPKDNRGEVAEERVPDEGQAVDHLGVSGERFGRSYETDVDLTQTAEGTKVDPDKSLPVLAEVTYVDAFDGARGDALESHVDYPTGRLAIMVLMPDGFRCTKAVGLRKVTSRAGGPQQVTPAPVVMGDGAVVYWAVEDPLLGAAYQVKWDWLARA